MANHRCAVLGKPVAHSLSPVLHNAAYRSLKLDDWLYDKHEVGEDDLDAFLKGLDSTWAGLSLTMPLKKTIQPYGVPENLWAKELKVANTAVFDWSVAADDPAWPNGKPGIKLYNATYVINTIPGHAADNVADALANAGTEPFSGLLLDVIYDPRPTMLMEAWRAHGGHAIGGEEMLLYQALVQVLLMTGIWDDDPPSDADQRLQDTTTEDDQLEIAMRKALEEAL